MTRREIEHRIDLLDTALEMTPSSPDDWWAEQDRAAMAQEIRELQADLEAARNRAPLTVFTMTLEEIAAAEQAAHQAAQNLIDDAHYRYDALADYGPDVADGSLSSDQAWDACFGPGH